MKKSSMKRLVALALVIVSVFSISAVAFAAGSTGVYNTAAVHLRSTIGGTSLGLVNKNTTCDIITSQTVNGVEWYKVTITSNTTNGGINLNGRTGWSQARYIDVDGSSSVPSGGPQSKAEAFGSASLREGDEGNYVRNVQLCLVTKGYDIDIDGDFGPATLAAVEAYQRSVGLDDDGVVGNDTKTAFWNDLACRNALMERGY